MLSSVANRCYWTGRYLERAENTARLVDVYGTLLLDLPKDAGVSWEQLISICGIRDGIPRGPQSALESRVVKFMVADAENQASILFSINQARENLRTLRDVVPRESYKLINEFHRFAQQRLVRATSVRSRQELLGDVVSYCQQLTGLLAGTMSHNETYQFLRLGRNLERADMTSRVLDVAGELLDDTSVHIGEHETTLWVNVLRSTSGYQAYRQQVKSRITPAGVVSFLLADTQFPRSISHCLAELDASAQTLPANTATRKAIKRARGALSELSLRELVRESLHEEVDNLQVSFNHIGERIVETWFAPASTLRAR